MCGRPDFKLLRSPKMSTSFLYSAVRPMPKGGRTKGPLSGSLVRPPVGSQPPATSRRLLEGRQGLQSSRSHSGDVSAARLPECSCRPARLPGARFRAGGCLCAAKGFCVSPRQLLAWLLGGVPAPALRVRRSGTSRRRRLPPFDVLDLAPDCLEGRRWFVGLSPLPPRFFRGRVPSTL